MDHRRRQLLLATAGLALGGALRPLPLLAAPRFASTPFTLGVASGDPLADGFVLWTRLAPEPLDGGGMPAAAVEVDWLVAEDPGLKKVVQRGIALAHPDAAHSVHVEVEGLRPDRVYWYRFRCGGHASTTGRTRTAPQIGAPAAQCRLAWASCQHYEQGYFSAYRHMAADAPDLILHLGDYIYEGSWGEPVRRHEAAECTTLAGYRARHARYKMDVDLQAAHAAAPWLCTWDDHEVDNDYANAESQDGDPREAFLLRRAAAYQAYWEHLPLRRRARPVGADALLYSASGWGDLLGLFVLDNRQYRSDQPCATPEKKGGQVVQDCAARLAPERTLLGPEQERWLLGSLGASQQRWNVLAQQMLMAQLDQTPGPGQGWWTDGWDGYAAARARILQHLYSRKVPNPVVLGGDIHSFWANDLKLDFDEAGSPTVASEFVGTSITSRGVPYEQFAAMRGDNPQVRFFDSRSRGYSRATVTPERWQTDFVALSDVRDVRATAKVLARFVVEAGRPGVQQA